MEKFIMKQSGLLLWFFAVATVFGQPDSKIFVLKNSLLQESDKREIVNLLNELAWEYRQINLDSSLYYAQNGLRIAIEFLYLEGQADSWNRIGNAWEAVGNYEESKNAYMRALSIDQQIGIPYGIGRDNHQIGVVLAKSANLEEALEFELKSIKILENSSSERKDSLALGNIYNSTGGIFID
ncbi:MAG: tetratricopeptide repeat protein [Bacteroidota bacterium]